MLIRAPSWASGRLIASHAIDPSSILGLDIVCFFYPCLLAFHLHHQERIQSSIYFLRYAAFIFDAAGLIHTHFSSLQDSGFRLHYLSIVIVAALSFYHIVQHWYWVFKRTKSQKAIESHLSNHHIFVPSLEASFMPSSHKR